MLTVFENPSFDLLMTICMKSTANHLSAEINTQNRRRKQDIARQVVVCTKASYLQKDI